MGGNMFARRENGEKGSFHIGYLFQQRSRNRTSFTILAGLLSKAKQKIGFPVIILVQNDLFFLNVLQAGKLLMIGKNIFQLFADRQPVFFQNLCYQKRVYPQQLNIYPSLRQSSTITV